MNLKNTLIGAGILLAAGAATYHILTERGRVKQNFENYLANPELVESGTVLIKTKERSELDDDKILIRDVAPDDTVTTYKFDPADLSSWQRYLLTKNWYRIENDTFVQDIPYIPFI